MASCSWCGASNGVVWDLVFFAVLAAVGIVYLIVQKRRARTAEQFFFEEDR